MPVEPQRPYISSKEAARKFDLTNDHIGLLCRRAKIQGLLWGRVWYVSEPSLTEYLKKNSELKEARKQALSKQWRTAWTTAFIGFALYSFHANRVSADYVTPSPALQAAPTPLELSLASVAAAVGEFEKNIPTPEAPAVPAIDNKQYDLKSVSDTHVLLYLREGIYAVGEVAANILANSQAPALHVVYASDYAPQPKPADLSLADMLHALAAQMSAAVANTPVPQLSYDAPTQEPLFTVQNMLAGTEAANELIAPVNNAMFAVYAESISQFVRYAQFDAVQAEYTFDQVFGEFGRQYVSDLSRLNDEQVHAYLAAGNAVNRAYNQTADVFDAMPSLDSSISVAAVADGYEQASPRYLLAAMGETIAGLWNCGVDHLSNFFVTTVNASNTLVENI